MWAVFTVRYGSMVEGVADFIQPLITACESIIVRLESLMFLEIYIDKYLIFK
ncbi:hypothetical protein HZU77_011715 [Neisseriaceae bacterium TC5R-5]|nr:hypothetical protein [Neisseriaceae bacterium TC5R-5]